MSETWDALRLQGGDDAKLETVPADLLAGLAVQMPDALGLDPLRLDLPADTGDQTLSETKAVDWDLPVDTQADPSQPAEDPLVHDAPLFRLPDPSPAHSSATPDQDHATMAWQPEAHHAARLVPAGTPDESLDHLPLISTETGHSDPIGAAVTFYRPTDAETGTVAVSAARSNASTADDTAGHSTSTGISGNVSLAINPHSSGLESIYIDTLVSGVKLDATGPIHYYLAGTSDLATFKAEYGGNPTLYSWSTDQKAAAEEMFQLYENVTSLQFVETTDYNDADIVWWQSNAAFFTNYFGTPGYIGFNEFPNPNGTVLPLYGVFDHDYFSSSMFQGGDGFLTMMHELGHGLGLAHPHDGGGSDNDPSWTVFPGVSSSSSEGTYQLNQQIWTEMSYNRGWDGAPWTMNYGGAGTPMALDIAALQDIYGANTTFNSGDDTYDLPTANAKGTYWSAIWDTGGTDTIDGSASKSAVFIDLREAPLDGPNAGGYVSWQKGIGGGFTIAHGVVIENAIGGSGADTITGNDADNKLIGNGGNDTLDGGAGKDDLQGGSGNDTYYVDDVGDKITEAASGGTDTVRSTIDVDLAGNPNLSGEIENIVLLDSAAKATGNGLNNAITGDDAANTLDGGAGNDTMTGGKGDDIYIVDSTGDRVVEAGNAGTDEVDSAVTFSLASFGNVENLVLTGSDAIDGTGNALANSLTGNGNDNVLNGGAGIDTFDGGAGDDTYILDNTAELAKISDASGTDTIKTAVQITTAVAGIENYTNTGATAWTLDLSGQGNVANTVIGGSGADKLTGGDGDDILNGGLGADTMNGGLGADTYYVDNVKDTITDADNGNHLVIYRSIDLVKDYGGIFVDVTLTGATAINAYGDGSANVLIGNAGNNILDGRGGADTLSGGAGNDTYVVYNQGEDIVEKANEGIDTIKSNFSIDLAAGPLTGKDFIENLVVLDSTAGVVAFTGNALNNILTGGTGGDTLDGGAGNDTMTGGKGNDLYIVDSVADKIVESYAGTAGGVDTVESSVTFSLAALANIDNLTLTGADQINGIGNGLANMLIGNGNDNVLDGKGGIDTFDGGLGNDTYVLDNIAEIGKISDAGGIDTVKTALKLVLTDPILHVENYINTGSAAWDVNLSKDTGVDHTITGGSGADKLTTSDGSDRLDGGRGIDILTGGDGDDIYLIDNTRDSIVETLTGGHDLVKSSATYTLAANVEDLTLTGTAAINGTGNAGDNVITGNTGRNAIIGGGGDDTLTGGAGIDTFKYTALTDRGTGNETITDFTAGKGGDILDVHDLLIGLGTTATKAVTEGFLQFTDDGLGNTRVEIDEDGAFGGVHSFVTLTTLIGVTNFDQTDTPNLRL